MNDEFYAHRVDPSKAPADEEEAPGRVRRKARGEGLPKLKGPLRLSPAPYDPGMKQIIFVIDPEGNHVGRLSVLGSPNPEALARILKEQNDG